MPVPQHSASAQNPLRHHGYSRCSAPLQQAQVLECVGAQRRGGILLNWLISVWTGTDSTGIINGLLFCLLLFCEQALNKLFSGSFLSHSAWFFLQPIAPSFSSFSPSSSETQEPSLLLSASADLLPLALSVYLSLLQLLPSTQDLPEMCRFRLLGNTTVLLKLQMEALQSNVWLVAFSAGRSCWNVVWPHEFIHMLCSNKYELHVVSCPVSV